MTGVALQMATSPGGSSNDSLATPHRKLHQLPFELWAAATGDKEEDKTALTNLSQLAALDPSQPLSLSEAQLEGLLAELKGLEGACHARLQALAGQSQQLGKFIAEELQISNVDEWLERNSKPEEEQTTETETKPSADKILEAQPQPRSNSQASQSSQQGGGTTLRLKLNTAQLPPRAPGTGSKNLSRMNRPAEKNLDAQGKGKGSVANQVPINVFWNYVEPFFKPIDEHELKFLDDPTRVIDPTPFTIPPLGRPYEEQWREQYGFAVGGGSEQGGVGGKRRLDAGLVSNRPTLRDRLLSMLMEESLIVPEEMNDPDLEDEMEVLSDAGAVITPVHTNSQPPSSSSPSPTAAAHLLMPALSPADQIKLDQRIRQEMVALGWEEFGEVEVDAQEDDEICRELRTLQQRLRHQVCLNHYRKKKLAELARTRLPAQEFYTLLAEVDRQVEQLYQRRVKGPKKRKNNTPSLVKRSSSTAGLDSEPHSGTSSVPPEALPAQFKVLETRQSLLTHFAGLIPPLKEVLASTTAEDPLFPEPEETAVLKLAEEEGSWLPIPEHLLPLSHTSRPLPTTQPVFPAEIVKK